MTIRLTPRQYRTLVKMAWLASRVAHGSEQHESDTVRSILELADTICNLAGDFQAEDMFEPVPPNPDEEPAPEFSVGGPEPLAVRLTEELEEEMAGIIEWFEEYSFWEILEDRLAMRDISEERSEAQWNWLPDSEKDRLYNQFVDFYFEEFAESGLASLRLVPPQPGDGPKPEPWSGAPAPEPERGGKIIDFPKGGRPDGKPGKKPRS